jgi:hypothetical protein
MKSQSRAGIGIITRNRPDFFGTLVGTMPSGYTVVVVNDGKPYPPSVYGNAVDDVVQHARNTGIARSKNDALRWLMKAGCRHLFLLEDDIAVRDPDIFEKYVQASEITGIFHFNYAFHGDWNRDGMGDPLYKSQKTYGDGITLTFHHNLTGALSYYRDEVIETVGYMDETYQNVLEHVDHTYRIIQHGFHPPFWWFADILDSYAGIQEQDPRLTASTNRHRWLDRTTRAKIFGAYFFLKHGCRPSRVPAVGEPEFTRRLADIQRRLAETDAR